VNAYVDSSILLRLVLGEREALSSWAAIDQAVSSELVRVECLRTIDRARLRLGLDDADVAYRRAALLEVIDRLALVPLMTPVLDRAAEPFPTSLGSLDAIHLATALLVRDEFEELVFATHDRELALGAQAMGFEVAGIA
jgi:uncharacterized protein